MTTTESEAAEVLLQEHFPKCIIGETSSHLGPMVEGQPDAMRWGMASKIFTESRIRFAVKQLSASVVCIGGPGPARRPSYPGRGLQKSF